MGSSTCACASDETRTAPSTCPPLRATSAPPTRRALSSSRTRGPLRDMPLLRWRPRWYAGASELFSEMKDLNMASTTERNPLTGTTMEGCVSNAAKHMLLEVETHRYELDFFEEIKDLFWRRVASHPKRSKLRTSVWLDFP